MPPKVSEQNGKQKKSKLEKIFELEADLKFAKEQNIRLRKALSTKQGGDGDAVEENDPNESAQMKRIKEAFHALRNVTVSQEKNLHMLRNKAAETKKELHKKEALIASLENKVKSLRKTQDTLTKSKSTDALTRELDVLQQALFDEQAKSAELRLTLDEKDKAIESLQARLDSRAAATPKCPKTGNAETNHLERELRKKSREVEKLKEELIAMAQELHELKHKRLSAVSTASSFYYNEGNESDFSDGSGEIHDRRFDDIYEVEEESSDGSVEMD